MAQKKVTKPVLTPEQHAENAVLNGVLAICTAHPQTTRAHAAKLIGNAGNEIAFKLARDAVSAEFTAGKAARKVETVGLKPPVAPVLKPPVKAAAKTAQPARKRA